MTHGLDAKATVARLKEEAGIRRKKSAYAQRRSLLDAYKSELLAMDAEGANGTDLQTWLKQTHKITVERSTVNRWLHKNRAQNG